MTVPIQEPTTDRSLQNFAFQRDQIFRRPAPRAGVLEWGRAEFTTDQGSGVSFDIQWDQAYVPANQSSIVEGTSSIDIFNFEAMGFYAVHFWATWNAGSAWGATEQRFLFFTLNDSPNPSTQNPVVGPKQTGVQLSNFTQNAVTPCWFLGAEVIDPSVGFSCSAAQGSGGTRQLTQGGVTVLYLGPADPADGGTAFS